MGSCFCACGGAGDGVGVTTGAGEAEASTTLSTGGGGGGGSGREPGAGDELLKTATKTRSIIDVPQRKSDKSILRYTQIRINGDFTYL
jgi:hypothetical protein